MAAFHKRFKNATRIRKYIDKSIFTRVDIYPVHREKPCKENLRQNICQGRVWNNFFLAIEVYVLYVFLGIVSYVHLGNFVVQLVEINLAVNAAVVGIASVVQGHDDLHILVVVYLTLRLVFVQIQQPVESVNLENTVLLVHRNQYHAKKVLLIFQFCITITGTNVTSVGSAFKGTRKV